jgi:hypothetical protein
VYIPVTIVLNNYLTIKIFFMNHLTKKRTLLLFTVLFSAVLIFTRCGHEVKDDKKCCEGYTGAMSDPRADSLKTKCHFISKDSIIVWTARYQANKNLICTDSLPGVGHVLGDSCSFNRCIIKAIICNENCIGLRVIYGMNANKKVKIILVGIKPDYSTLYIPKPNECCPSPAMAKSVMGSGSGVGGAEYAQWP